MAAPNADRELDARTLVCPMPLLKTRQALRRMRAGEILCVTATDSGSRRDIPAWLRQSRHVLVHCDERGDESRFWIRAAGEDNDHD